MVLRAVGWRVVCWAWVASAIIGVPPWWWWTVASLVVLAGTGSRPVVQRAPVFGWVAWGCLVVYLIHARQPHGTAAQWVLHASLLLAASHALAERDGWIGVREAVMWCAWAQLPLMAWQALWGDIWWQPLGGGLTGSVNRRSTLAVLLAVASLFSVGRRATWLGLSSLLTGSLMGAPVALRWVPSRWRLVSALAGGVLLAPWWMERAWLRVSSWGDVPGITRGWLTGWGFLPLPGGFRYDGGPDGIMAQTVLNDYHSAILDWWARTGLVGMAMLIVVLGWAWRRSRTPEARWLFVFAVWVGSLQSVEHAPALVMLLLAWWIKVTQHTGGVRDAVAPV